MKRNEKLALRQHQSSRQLMGIQRITPHGVTTACGELMIVLVWPDSLTALSEDGVRVRITALANLLRKESAAELIALDSREPFQRNQVLCKKMDAYCQTQTGLHQEDCRVRYLPGIQGPAAPQL